MRTALSNRCQISAKNIVSPCQYPVKNPGKLSVSGSGWVAHDASAIILATVAAMRNNLNHGRKLGLHFEGDRLPYPTLSLHEKK